MDVKLVKAEDIKEKEKGKENYAITALDGIYRGARQYLLDAYSQEYDESLKKLNIDEAIAKVECAFLEWEKTGRPDIRTWYSAIYLVDIIVAAGILHEKLDENEEIPTKYAIDLGVLEEKEE